MSSAEASSPRIANIPLIIINIMKILRSIGLGIAIITLKLLMPEVWHSFESTLVSFFSTMQKVLAVSPADALPANVIGFPQVPK
jgi:hypothetical protein